jgi:asparagine synthetase B (glutamine-hydrolysing)
MQIILEYNIHLSSVTTDVLKTIYLTERNACFAGVYYDDVQDVYYALSDHLGNVPLFYSLQNNILRFSFYPLDYIEGALSKDSVQRFLATGSLRFLQESACGTVSAGTIMQFKKVNGMWTESVFHTYAWNLSSNHTYSKNSTIQKLDALLEQATRRLVKSVKPGSAVSLALSGGIDSALTAHYLQRVGMTVDAFTVSPWGKDGVEAVRASETAKTLGVHSHTIFDLQTQDYQTYLEQYKHAYPYPNGSVASLTISTLFNQTEIGNNGTVFFAQNADTLFCAVIHQFSTFLYMCVPEVVRSIARFPYFKPHQSLLENYRSFVLLGNEQWWPNPIIPNVQCKTSIQKLSFAGMLWGHTPSDGEVFIAPGIHNKIAVKNIFYDVDLIEYVVQLPLRHRVSWSHESKIGIALSKRLLIELAHTVGVGKNYQKKGLVLPKNRDVNSVTFFNKLPNSFNGVALHSENHQFALKMLEEYNLVTKNK